MVSWPLDLSWKPSGCPDSRLRSTGLIMLALFISAVVHLTHSAVCVCMCVPSRWAHQPGHVLWTHSQAILAWVVRGPGGFVLWNHRGQRLALQTPRSGPLLWHRQFPGGRELTHATHSHTTRPTVAIAWQRPNGPLAVWLWHGHRVLWNRPAQVLTQNTHVVHNT